MKLGPTLYCLLVALLALGPVSMREAAAQPAPWAEREVIDVVNASPDLLVDHQIRLEFDSAALVAANRLRSDGGDLRFGPDIEGSTTLPYWVDSGMNTANTVVWISVSEIPADGRIAIYMYFGNPAATSESSLDAVFPPAPEVRDDSSTLQVDNGAAGGVPESQRGFRFHPNEDVLMVAMGKREPTGTTRYITLFDAATQQILEQMQVSGPAATYTYTPMPAHRWLQAGQIYILQMYTGVADGYYFGSSSQIHPALTYLDMRYCNGCDQNTFPSNHLKAIHYGYPDMLIRTRKPATPQPTATLAVVSSVVTLAADANPAGFGSDVLLTATVQASLPPTGTVTFSEGVTPVCADVPLELGVAQCTVPAPALGLHDFTATYGGALPIAGSDDNLVVEVTPVVPGAPTALVATPGNTTISLAFTAPEFDGGAAIESYTGRCTDGVDTISVTGVSPMVFEGLSIGVEYQCSVVATNAVGDSEHSPAVAATPVTFPDAPTGLSALSGDGQATLMFDAPVFDGGTAILFYTGYCVMPPLPPVIVSADGAPLVVTGLSNATTYTCYVTASNAVGESVVSNPAQVTPIGVPGVPTGVSAASGDMQATVSFSPPAFDGGSEVLQYTAICDDGNVGANAGSTGSPIIVSGLQNGSTYGCSVHASNAIGDGPSSAPIDVVPAGVPDAPDAPYAVPGDGSVALYFTAPFDGGSPILQYEASCTDGTTTLDATGAGSPLEVDGLANFVTYTCTVLARNAVGDGAPSAASSVTPPIHLLLEDGFEPLPPQ